MEKYNFFKTPNQLIDSATEGLIGNKGSSLVVGLIYFLSKACFLAGLTTLIVGLAQLRGATNNYSLIFWGIGLLILALFSFGPLKVSFCKNALNMINNTSPKAKDVWFGFKNKYFRNVWFGICLFVSYLFHILLIVFPFFIKYFSYQVAGFILAEDNGISAIGALKLSSKMTKGFRKTYFKIILKFIPQMLLCLITLYIYSLWLRPKFNTVVGCYYQDIKE